MTEFINEDFNGVWFRNVYFEGAHFRGAYLVNADIDGVIDGLRINGVEVAPLVEAELNRRYPERVKMSPTDAAGFREAYAILERLWAETVEKARKLPPELLHERVDGEWSFIETLRHLVFATDSWVLRAVLGQPAPWSPLGLPHDEMPAEMTAVVPWDRAARPSLDEIVAVRRERADVVRKLLEDFDLEGSTVPVEAPGYPPTASYPVRRCVGAIITEEWEHRLFAERDLDALTGR
ncbi:DinB family protein [Actinoplanes sp. L3-i22]|uniref:DinB family protein n=1 Tax=Actinoplanes sp. L3-i22 TaxID=2836373 RepID=UPI001C753313|nr:DinB family protein [Actinoplanes sp. L3-i22]BCY10413.1 hypothetical protein L3i22_055010 [Actinoplanes sp. L3-i22]